MEAQDILLDDNWDLLIENGDLVAGNSNEQHLALIVQTGQGHWKENPFLGFFAQGYLGTNTPLSEMKTNLDEQLESDHFNRSQLNIDSNNNIINLDAKRYIV